MTISIVPIYAALLAALFFLLSVRTIRLRRELKIAIGDHDNQTMRRAARVHANFAEYVPLTLLLLLFVELQHAAPILLHVQCACLLAGRCIHAYGVSQPKENFSFRVFGMSLTFTALLSAAAFLLVKPIVA